MTGKVLDENGEPVIGASIKVTGTTTGTITDFDGNFTLNNVPKGAKIEISYIGYLTQTVEAKGNEPLTIKLAEDNQMLDEVVVVGYGTQRVKDLTGSATNVKVEDIIDLPGASLVDALAGQVVGLSVNESSGRPGATGSFTIRQPMSFDESSTNFNQPLIVIDGHRAGGRERRTQHDSLQHARPVGNRDHDCLEGCLGSRLRCACFFRCHPREDQTR